MICLPVPIRSLCFPLSPVEYTLSVESEGHQWLFASLPKASSVVEGENKDFLVHVSQSQSELKSIDEVFRRWSCLHFQERQISNKENDATKFAHKGFIVLNDANEGLSGTYLLGMHGVTASSFAVSSTIIVKGGKTENYVSTLEEGTPQKGVFCQSKRSIIPFAIDPPSLAFSRKVKLNILKLSSIDRDSKITIYKQADIEDIDIFLSLKDVGYLTSEKSKKTTEYTFKS